MSGGGLHPRWDVAVPMRDGTRLSADLHFPPAGSEGGPYPAILARTPYDNQHPVYVADARYFASHGYVVILQDVRGRHDSDGVWDPFRLEGPDGYDTVEWIAEQSWSNGKVGTFGGSYGGWDQWALAREKPPHLTTMVSTAAAGAWMEELPWHNGVLMLTCLGWLNLIGGRAMQNPELVDNWPEVFRHLPVREMDDALGRSLPTWRDWVDHPTRDGYWNALRLDDDFAHIDIPALHITGWFDADQPGALFFHAGMSTESSRAADQRIVIGPWDHQGTRVPSSTTGDVDFGEQAVIDVRELHRRWYDRWLKDVPGEVLPEGARLFLTGANAWFDCPSWPPPSTHGQRWHLRADEALSEELPEADKPSDTFIYDPQDPVPSVVDENFYAASAKETPLDHSFQFERDDVLVYTSAPAQSEVILAGIATVHLFASTDGPDTDWFVSLHDIAEDGTSMQLTEGRLRGRFREGLDREVLLTPGETNEFVIPTTAIGHVLKVGHALRLAVTSSAFPTWDRNPNTGAPIGTTTELRVARNTIHHSEAAASYVTIPVIDPSTLRPASDAI